MPNIIIISYLDIKNGNNKNHLLSIGCYVNHTNPCNYVNHTPPHHTTQHRVVWRAQYAKQRCDTNEIRNKRDGDKKSPLLLNRSTAMS